MRQPPGFIDVASCRAVHGAEPRGPADDRRGPRRSRDAWPLRHCLRVALATLLSLTAASTAAQAPVPSGDLQSCVTGSRPLAIGSRRALLDDEDRAGFEAAVLVRFRVLAESGFAAGQVLLVERADGGWTYVNLRPAREGTAACFTATFSGEALAFTPQLVRKYFLGADKV